MKKFTIIGFVNSTGQIICDHAEAASAYKALYNIKREDVTIVGAFEGHLKENQHVFFAGESIVDIIDIKSQPEVFNT